MSINNIEAVDNSLRDAAKGDLEEQIAYLLAELRKIEPHELCSIVVAAKTSGDASSMLVLVGGRPADAIECAMALQDTLVEKLTNELRGEQK